MPSYSKLPSLETLTDLVWIQTGFIGDIILTTGAMARAKKLFPHVHHHLVTTKTGKLILEKGFPLSSLHVFDKSSGMSGIWTAAKAVRDHLGLGAVTLQPHLSTRSSLLAAAIGNPVITFHEASLGFLASRRVPRVAVFHEADRNAVLLEGLGVSRELLLDVRPTLEILALPQSGALSALKAPKKWIGVAPGSIWGTKRWPVEKFSALVLKLLSHSDVGVALIGGKDEQDLCQIIFEDAKNSAGERLVNLAGQTSLDDLRALFPALKLVVSNDSSPVHYGSAYNIPTVEIYGPTIPAFGFGPLADKSSIVETKGLDCRPCGNHGPQKCPLGHFLCMKQIDVERVYEACLKVVL